jgi:phage shock protein PspC (stress-responsive transcriptional regulator)
MKRVENIHINGIIFSIEDDAYAGLSAYIDALNKYFKHEQGGNEIMFDIESRIAELFTERPGGTGKVITAEDVLHVTEVLGAIEDITGTGDNSEASEQSKQEKTIRRLYRDLDRRCIGGVCAGISHWTGIHSAFFRILFVVLLPIIPISLLVYIILWISVPKAETTAQKLEMHGKPVNISNIEKNIKRQLSDSDSKLNRSIRQVTTDIENFLNEFGDIINRFFGIGLRMLCIFAGIFLILCGLSTIVGMICLYFMQDIFFGHLVEWDLLSFNELFKYIATPLSYHILSTCVWLIAALMAFALIFWGMKLMVNFKLKYHAGHIALFLAWFCALITAIVLITGEALRFSSHGSLQEKEITVQADTLYLTAIPFPQLASNPAGMYFDKKRKCFYGKPRIHIMKSDDEQIKVAIRKQARGSNKPEAHSHAENISFVVGVKDSAIVFPSFFGVTPTDAWKFQQVDVFLRLPVGTAVVFGDNVLSFLREWNRWGLRHGDNIRIMTEERGLQPPVEKK